MKKALILGITGQDGSYLAEFLLANGYEVFGTSRDAEMASLKNLERLKIRDRVKVESASLNDFRSIFQVLAKIQPDELYNLAGQTSVALSYDQPVETFESIGTATLNILESLRITGIPARFYNACSSECYGDTPTPAHELVPFRPKSPYAVAKAAAFWHVQSYRETYGLYACSGILFNHESPLRPERFVTKKIVSTASRIARGSKEKLHLGDLSIERDWGYAPEYVKAMWLMLQQDRPDDYVIATGETHTLEDFLESAFAEVGLDWHDHVVIDPLLMRPNDLKVSRADPSKACDQLMWIASYGMHEVVKIMISAELSNTL